MQLKTIYSILAMTVMTSALPAYADSVIDIEGVATGMTPDGKLVVGTKSQWEAYTSFLYTTATSSLEWKTDGSGEPLAGGSFVAVNNSGIIAGNIRNPEMRISEGGGGGFFAPRKEGAEEEGSPIRSAAVWRDGKTYVLGTGPYTNITDFVDPEDGSVATGISADGNIVFGKIIQSWFPLESCVWVYDSETDKYEYYAIAIPDGCRMAELNKVSGQGFPAVGRASMPMGADNFMGAAVWLSPDEAIFINIPGNQSYYSANADAISSDGKYVAVTADGAYPYLGIYDLTNGDLKQVELPSGTTSASVSAITDEGNMILTIKDSNWVTEYCYFDNASGQIVSLAEYLGDVYQGEIDTTAINERSAIAAVSGDGRYILASNAEKESSILIEIENPKMKAVGAPEKVSIYHSSLTTLAVAFEGVASIPEGSVLVGYRVYVDGKMQEIEATTTGGEFEIAAEGEVGKTHTAYVTTVYGKDNEIKESAGSETVRTYVSADTSLIAVYNFDDSSIDGQGNIIWNQDTWSPYRAYGSNAEAINWHLTAEDFENRTPYLATYSIATQPWSCHFVSHFMDATDAKDFLLDLRYKMKYINTIPTDCSGEYLDVELSADGKNWEKVASVAASDIKAGNWRNLRVDLGKDWAGKIFQVRINAHGDGKCTLNWNVDDIVIADKCEKPAPAGLRVLDQSNGELELAWLNSMGMYDVSYVPNSGILWDYNVSGEGEPLMSAIKLDSDKLKPYEGQYINAVSTFLFDDETIENTYSTSAEAIVFADGKRVASGDFNTEFYTVDQPTAWLDAPVLIEPGVTYLVAVQIYDYDPRQAPMYYQADASFKAGVTDLYSEDEGATWKNASEAVASENNPNGCCIWPIRAHILSEPTTWADGKPDSDLLRYSLLRNGEELEGGTIYEPHPHFIDKSPLDKATYTLRAYYVEGGMSQDTQLYVDMSSVESVEFTLKVRIEGSSVIVDGDCRGITLVDMSGKTVARTTQGRVDGVAPGVYVLVAKTSAGNETYKVMVR